LISLSLKRFAVSLVNQIPQALYTFLSSETFFNVIDSLELRLSIQLGKQTKQSKAVSKKGKSNHRWIIGRKINIAINGELEVTDYQDDTANVCDNTFDENYAGKEGYLYLTDKGYRKQEKYGGTPKNFKICTSGTWNERMWIERLFSLWTEFAHEAFLSSKCQRISSKSCLPCCAHEYCVPFK